MILTTSPPYKEVKDSLLQDHYKKIHTFFKVMPDQLDKLQMRTWCSNEDQMRTISQKRSS